MTDDDKALVKQLRVGDPYEVGDARHKAADRIEALSAEVEKFSGLARLAILKAYDTDKALSAENERLREAQESVLPSLEHYYQIAIENGHPEFIEAAMLALHTAYAALGDEA